MTTKEQILKCFKDINHAYNDCTRYDTLKRMLDELQEPCEDAISREAVLDATVKKNSIWNSITNSKGENLEKIISQLPPINPQIICPIHGVYCEDCSAYEKKLNKWIGAEVLDKIRAEIDAARFLDKDKKLFKNANASGLEVAMDIIDKYKAEGSGEE